MRRNAASLHVAWHFCNDRESFWFCKKKVKKLLREIKNENLSSKDARIYLTGHLGYFNIANTYTLKKKNILLQDELLREKIIY